MPTDTTPHRLNYNWIASCSSLDSIIIIGVLRLTLYSHIHNLLIQERKKNRIVCIIYYIIAWTLLAPHSLLPFCGCRLFYCLFLLLLSVQLVCVVYVFSMIMFLLFCFCFRARSRGYIVSRFVFFSSFKVFQHVFCAPSKFVNLQPKSLKASRSLTQSARAQVLVDLKIHESWSKEHNNNKRASLSSYTYLIIIHLFGSASRRAMPVPWRHLVF